MIEGAWPRLQPQLPQQNADDSNILSAFCEVQCYTPGIAVSLFGADLSRSEQVKANLVRNLLPVYKST